MLFRSDSAYEEAYEEFVTLSSKSVTEVTDTVATPREADEVSSPSEADDDENCWFLTALSA